MFPNNTAATRGPPPATRRAVAVPWAPAAGLQHRPARDNLKLMKIIKNVIKFGNLEYIYISIVICLNLYSILNYIPLQHQPISAQSNSLTSIPCSDGHQIEETLDVCIVQV